VLWYWDAPQAHSLTLCVWLYPIGLLTASPVRVHNNTANVAVSASQSENTLAERRGRQREFVTEGIIDSAQGNNKGNMTCVEFCSQWQDSRIDMETLVQLNMNMGIDLVISVFAQIWKKSLFLVLSLILASVDFFHVC